MKKTLGIIKAGIEKELLFYKKLSRHPKTPKISKILLIAAIFYLLMPFDLIPDFIPILGQLDEVIIIPLLIYIALKFIPEIVIYETRESKDHEIKDAK